MKYKDRLKKYRKLQKKRHDLVIAFNFNFEALLHPADPFNLVELKALRDELIRIDRETKKIDEEMDQFIFVKNKESLNKEIDGKLVLLMSDI